MEHERSRRPGLWARRGLAGQGVATALALTGVQAGLQLLDADRARGQLLCNLMSHEMRVLPETGGSSADGESTKRCLLRAAISQGVP